MMRRLRAALGVAVAGAAVVLAAAPAQAADATIAHVETTGDGIRVLVTVPPGANVDLDGVTASLDGDPLEASAEVAGDEGVVERTAMLAIDTSVSMRRGGQFDAAKAAALTYLESVPSDVEVGIVTFDSDVVVALEPTTSRSDAEVVINNLELSRDTLLYDGVVAAVDAAGDTGQRSVLVLSDGADTGSAASLDDATGAIADAGVLVDVVALQQRGAALAALEAMATVGNGQVIESSGNALTAAFAREADLLASQILVTAPLPDGFAASEATVEVTLPTDGPDLVASALAPIQDVSDDTPAPLPAAADPASGWDVPGWLLYVGIGVLAVGAVTVAVLLVPGKPEPMSIADRVAAYSSRNRDMVDPAAEKQRDPVLDQAKAAAAGVLQRNRGLEERLGRRLSAAGSGFKPSEWLLLQVGVVIGATLLGLLVGGGNLIIGILFLIVGAIAPGIVLRWQAGRRRRAFDNNLPEVLQILAGALQAGLSLAQAVDTVVTEGPEPIASEFKRVLVETRIGMSLEDAFDGVAERFESKDFAWTVMAIRIQREVGGNLAELLTKVADTMRERAYLRRQVRTLSAEGRLSAIILCALPPLFAAFLLLTNPGFFEPLIANVRGYILLGFAVTWLTIGVLWMSRLVKVEV